MGLGGRGREAVFLGGGVQQPSLASTCRCRCRANLVLLEMEGGSPTTSFLPAAFPLPMPNRLIAA
jgi:hypothetical protein